MLDKFGIAVLGSKAVMARSLSVMLELLESDRRTYTSYHRQLAAGSRVPEDNEFDQVRTQFEAALFPNFHEKILYGCLTLNDVGLSGYGAYAIVFKDETIAHRATVFEENPYDFCTRHKLLMNDQIPSGYRATWEERGALAKAKLHSEITPTTSDAQFPDILLNDSGRTGGNNYIEVHIFGSFNRYSIEKMIGREPKTREDRLIWRQLEELLSDIGIVAETV